MNNKQIKKADGIIGDPNATPAPPAGAPAPTSKPRPQSGGSGYAPQTAPAPKTNPVLAMQDAILDLYNEFKTYHMFQRDPSFREVGAPIDTEHGEEPGMDTFLTFMLNRFVNKSPMIGTEYQINGPKKPAVPIKSVSQEPKAKPINFPKLLESMRTLGKVNVKNQITKPDGTWSEYTNNALKNTYAILFAMYTLMDKLKIDNTSGYSGKDLEELRKNIPNKLNTSINQAKAASIIIRNIKKSKKLLATFSAALTSEYGKYDHYVRQHKSFETNFQQNSYDTFDQSIIELTKENDLIGLPVKLPLDIGSNEPPTVTLTLNALLDKNKLLEFLKSHNIRVHGKDLKSEPEATLSSLLVDAVSYIEKELSVYNPKAQNLTEQSAPKSTDPGY